MRHEDRLSRAKVCEGRHERLAGRRRLACEGSGQSSNRPREERNPASKVEAQVERDLLVSRSPGVQSLARLAELLDQQPLHETVHVFVRAIDERGIRPAAFEQFRSSRIAQPDWVGPWHTACGRGGDLLRRDDGEGRQAHDDTRQQGDDAAADDGGNRQNPSTHSARHATPAGSG